MNMRVNLFLFFIFISGLVTSIFAASADTPFNQVLSLFESAAQSDTQTRSAISDHSSVITQYQTIATELEQGALAAQQDVHNAFALLSKTITRIMQKAPVMSAVRPRHVRWLIRDCDHLHEVAQEALIRVMSIKEKILVRKISTFAVTMGEQVLSELERNIGTPAQKLHDFLFHRPTEFCTRNWKWMAPAAVLTAVATKVGYDAYQHAQHCNVPPDQWDTQVAAEPDPKMSWYKKLVSGVAAAVFANQLHGYVRTEKGGCVGRPVQSEVRYTQKVNMPEGAGEVAVLNTGDAVGGVIPGELFPQRIPLPPQVIREVERNVDIVVTQLPCVHQSSLDCGLHAALAAVCLRTNNRALLVDPTAVQRHLAQWKYFLRARGRADTFLRSDGIEALIAHFDFFVPIRGENADNFSLIEAIWQTENALQRQGTIEYQIGVNQIGAVYQQIQDGTLDREALQHIGIAADWQDREEILHNIQRFQATGEPQIVILHNGGAHWLAFRLERIEGRDHVTIVDSLCNDQRNSDIVKRLYHIFRTDRLPQG